jgi:hypothetical protein
MGLEFSISEFYKKPEMTEIMPYRNMLNELQKMTTKCLEENSAEAFRTQQQNRSI